MKIKLVKSDWLDDWYTIERAEHVGRVWIEPGDDGVCHFMDSGRISDACVEGTASEMIEIAKAIKANHSASFKRCAVRVGEKFAYFYSPRNSQRDAEVPLEDAIAFADEALSELASRLDTEG